MSDGTLPCVIAPDPTGMPRRWTRLTAVLAYRARRTERLMLADFAETLGLRYHETYQMVRRLGLELDQHPTSRQYELTLQDADALRVEHDRVRALHQRSMKLAAAARQLHVSASTAGLLAKAGQLELDPETDSGLAKFVTRASVEACWMTRNTGRRKSGRPIPAVPVAEVARFTGYPVAALMDLVRAGILEQLPGRRATQLTSTSLRAWMAGRNPEDSDGTAIMQDIRLPTADGLVVALRNREGRDVSATNARC